MNSILNILFKMTDMLINVIEFIGYFFVFFFVFFFEKGKSGIELLFPLPSLNVLKHMACTTTTPV